MSVSLTHQQAVNREKDILEEMERLRNKADKTTEDRQKVNALLEEHRGFTRTAWTSNTTPRWLRIARPPKRRGAMTAGWVVDRGDQTRNAPVLGGSSATRGIPARSVRHPRGRASCATAPGRHRAHAVRQRQGSRVSARLIEGDDSTRMAEMVLGPPAPRLQGVRSPSSSRHRGRDAALTVDEREALQRAMAIGAGSTGGYLVPFQLDPSVIPDRRQQFQPGASKLARVVTATGDKWHGVLGRCDRLVGPGRAGVRRQPTLGQPEIPVHKGPDVRPGLV